MTLEYTYDDLKSAFKFGKKNQNSKLKDWFNYDKNQLTEEEKKLFKFIEVANVPIDASRLYLINWNGVGGGHFAEPFKIFKRKYFDNYYQFFNNCFGEFNVIITGKEFFNIKTFDKNKNYDGVYQKEITDNDVKIIILNYKNYDGEKDQYNSEKFYSWRNSLERNNCHFWQMGDWDIYISDPYKLKFTPALELLKKEEKLENV